MPDRTHSRLETAACLRIGLLRVALGLCGLLAAACGMRSSLPDDFPTPKLQPTAFESSWSRRRELIVHGTASDIASLPVLVTLDSAQIDYTLAQVSGGDLRFDDAATGETVSHEIERWDPNGTSTVWVNLPSLPSGRDTRLWMYYGNPEAADSQDPAAVWADNYLGVWHLSETAIDEMTGTVHAESSGNGAPGTQNNNATDCAGGAIGCAQDFDGGGDQVEVPAAALQHTGTELTLELRAFVRIPSINFPHAIGSGSDGRYWQIYWHGNNAAWSAHLRVAGVLNVLQPTLGGAVESWQTVALVYGGTTVRLYVDGAETDQIPATGNLDALDGSFFIGNNPAIPLRDFDGLVDEVRVSTVARSPEWLSASHESLTGALVDFGVEEAL